jgi:GT2 family glycosyltransferase
VGSARNKVVRESGSPWIAFIDDDEIAGESWLRGLYSVALMRGSPVVGGAIHLDLPEETISQLSICCRVLLGEGRFPIDQPEKLGDLGTPGSGNVLISREIFETVGLFDNTALAGEDSDLWTRVERAGFDMWHAPAAVVLHHVPSERLTTSYFRWNSLRWGATFAERDWKYGGAFIALLICLARIGKAALILAPRLAFAWLTSKPREHLDTRCALWRTVAYSRRCLFLLAPNVFPQSGFFSLLDFRKEREIGHESPADRRLV